MEVKRLHTIVSPTGEVLHREELLNSPEARGIIAEIEAANRSVATASQIFEVMRKRGIIKELAVQKVVEVDKISEFQRFTPKLIVNAKAEGWMELEGDTGVIHSTDGDIPFEVLQVAGRYCCHCGEKLTDDTTGAAAREHVAQKHKGRKSPDANNPSGYYCNNYVECQMGVNHG